MNKAMMFPIHKKWVDMIFNGTKKFEFRNKLPKHLVKGMKIYFYETLGDRKPKSKWEDYPLYIGYDTYEEPYASYVYEGTGMIVGEATVGEIYKIGVADRPFYDQKKLRSWSKLETFTKEEQEKMGIPFEKGFHSWMPIGVDELSPYGYTNQKYAIELTNVIKYDEEWLENIVCEDCKLFDGGYTNRINYETCSKLDTSKCPYHNAPTSPIAKEEFILWNKYQLIKDDKEKYLSENPNVRFSPQAPIYVVEREVN